MHYHKIWLLLPFLAGFPFSICEQIHEQADTVLGPKDEKLMQIITHKDVDLSPKTIALVKQSDQHRLISSQSRSQSKKKSFGQKMNDAMSGFVIGIIIFILAFPVVTISEGGYLHRLKLLKKAKLLCVDIDQPESGDVENQKPNFLSQCCAYSSVYPEEKSQERLVYTQAKLVSTAAVSDDQFAAISTEKAFLARKVEMYQLEKIHHKDEDGNITNTTERKNWFSIRKEEVENPLFPFESKLNNPFISSLEIKNNTLSTTQIRKVISNAMREPIILKNETQEIEVKNKNYKVEGEYYLYQISKGVDTVGDIRVSWQEGQLDIWSLISGIDDVAHKFKIFEFKEKYKIPFFCCGCCPWPIGAIIGACNQSCFGGLSEIDEIHRGTLTEQDIFAKAEKSSRLMKTVLRFLGFAMFFLGFYLFLNPIAIVSDWIPIIGPLIRLSIGLAAVVVSLVCYFLTLAFAWFYYRPCVTVGLIATASGILAGAYVLTQ